MGGPLQLRIDDYVGEQRVLIHVRPLWDDGGGGGELVLDQLVGDDDATRFPEHPACHAQCIHRALPCRPSYRRREDIGRK